MKRQLRTFLGLQERLQQIKNQLPEIKARLDALGSSSVADQPMTLREFTEKQLNGKRPDDQKADTSNPRAATKKYSAG
jgi:peptidoglycan hydrolase CwlO-like protein